MMKLLNMRKRLHYLAVLGLFVSLICLTTDAYADIRNPHSGSRPVTLDAPIGGFAWVGYGAVAGARLGIPILKNGFIPSINNAVYINFGVDVYFYFLGGATFGLGIPITLHWEFYFNRKWSAFAELGVNIFLNSSLFAGGAFLFSPAHWIIGAVGGKFHISPNFALVLRLGNPYASFGLSWSF